MKTKKPYIWECPHCHRQNYETQYRNLQRRVFKCICEQITYIEAEMTRLLQRNNFLLIDYTLNDKGLPDRETYVKIQCIKCNKIFSAYYRSLISGRLVCDCDPNKHFPRFRDNQEFISQWPKLNQENFTLLSDYGGRTKKVQIVCNKCQKTDFRWASTLLSTVIRCKYCSDTVSTGELLIQQYLDDKRISYIYQYQVNINNSIHIFDFYLPELNSIIEFNGKQHYEAVPFFGGEPKFEKTVERDLIKEQYCKEKKIKLITIKYNENINDFLNMSLKFND